MSDDFSLDSLDLDQLVADQAKRDEENRKRIKEQEEKAEAEKKERDRKLEESRRRGGGGGGGGKDDKPKGPVEVVTFDDIIGMETAKAEMREAVIYPLKYSALFSDHKMKPIKGCLLYGPPGNGKTLLGKAMAQIIATLNGKDFVEDAFAYFSGTDFLNMFVGQTEANIRKAFETARAFYKKHGYRQVMFIDEPDVLLSKRGSRSSGGGTVNDGAVTTFLTELDGIGRELGAFVMIATNQPGILDDALTRPGRIDRKVLCPRPTASETELLWAYYLGKKRVEDPTLLAKIANKEMANPKRSYATIHTTDGDVPFGLWDIRSGAMIMNLVEVAAGVRIAKDIDRALASGDEPFATNIDKSDIVAALDKEYVANTDLNHDVAMTELLKGKKPTGITKG